MLQTYPSIPAGTQPTSLLLQRMLPLIAEKASDQPLTSSTTLASDSALLVPLEASAKYDVELKLYYTGGTTGSSDLKFAWTVPSGTTITGSALAISNPLGVALLYYTQATASVFSASNGTGNPFGIRVWGTVVTSSTTGNLQLTWAQNTSSATATTVKAGSLLTARRIA